SIADKLKLNDRTSLALVTPSIYSSPYYSAMTKPLKNNKRNTCVAARLGNFIIFLILTIITLGLYPLFSL
ncbi:MAG: hypothetical protein ACI909_002465, partial [Planctomycetota bacterium]